MKRLWAKIWMTLFIILSVLATGAGVPQFSAHGQGQTTFGTDALVRIEVKCPIQNIGLPIYAHLRDGAGNDYALVIAPLKQVTDSGLSYQILDDPASPGKYYLASTRRKGAREAAAGLFTIIHDDGQNILVKGGTEVADKLSELGFDIKAIPTKPMILRTPFDIKAIPAKQKSSVTPQSSIVSTFTITHDPHVEAMINKVKQHTLYEETGNLTGENEVIIGRRPYTITTRHTNSGEPIQKATQYVYERMQRMGLTVSYHNWSASSFANRNVAGTKTGQTRPTEVVLITAHLDDQPASGSAPGADDNTSGSAALLVAAEIMTSGTFERTIRFVFFTGEEQGLYGSEAYANAAFSANENIVAVYNMDMIAWDSLDGPILRLHTRTPLNPGYDADMIIASTFSDVVAAYGLSSGLTPIITEDGVTWSDHSTFWDNGYAAIVAIEDDYDDFNEYYHTADDSRQRLNMTYFTNFTKASVGTAAHLAMPLDTPSHSGGSGCFIATAAFGSPLEKHVVILRNFRDTYLINNASGRILVNLYYRYSPPVARLIQNNESLRLFVRCGLLPVISFCYAALHYGLAAMCGVIIIISGIIFTGTLFLRRRKSGYFKEDSMQTI